MNVAEPLPLYVWVWSALPVLLVLIGGALGALVGFIAFATNTRIFRTPWSRWSVLRQPAGDACQRGGLSGGRQRVVFRSGRANRAS